jgi:hypothetical protein
VVCFSTFHDILKNHFNLSFYAPKNDTWNRCDTFNRKIKKLYQKMIKKEKFSGTGIVQPKQPQQERGRMKTQPKQNVMKQKRL